MNKWTCFVVSLLLVATACTNSLAPEFREPTISGSALYVVGEWQDKKLICPIQLTINAPDLIELEEGEVWAFMFVRPVTLEEISSLWGLEVRGVRKAVLRIEPPFYNIGYDASLERPWTSESSTGTLRYEWECIPPEG